MKWLRLYHEARTDAKLESLPDDEFRVWFRLLCFAGEQPMRGTISNFSPRLLAANVARGDTALLTRTLASLKDLRIVDEGETGGGYHFTHWEKRQFGSDDTYARVLKHRTGQTGEDETFHPGADGEIGVNETFHDGDETFQKRFNSALPPNETFLPSVSSVVSVSSASLSPSPYSENRETERERERETDANASAPTPDGAVAAPVPLPVPVKASPNPNPKREPRYSREEQGYVAALLDAYKGRLRVKKLSAEGKERAAAHWFYHAGPEGEPVPVETVMHVYDLMKSRRFWQGKLLSLQKVAEQFPEYANDPVAFAADGPYPRAITQAASGVTQEPDPPLPGDDAPLPDPEPPAPPRVFHLAGYTDGAKVWRAASAALRKNMSAQQFDTWFGGVSLLLPPRQQGQPPDPDPDAALTLIVRSTFVRELLSTRFHTRIESALRAASPALAAAAVPLRIVCAAEVVTGDDASADNTDEPPPAA